jgi:hypothetical protein
MGLLCKRTRLTWIFLTSLSAFLINFSQANPIHAEDSADNSVCFQCHSSMNLEMSFPSGEKLNLYVDADQFEATEHGRQGMACTSCHTDITGYPHPALSVQTYRDFSLLLYPTCTKCHQEQIGEIKDNVHMVALNAGNPNAAICTDCHGKHDIRKVSESVTPINRTCGKCHTEINALYEKSVHGAALIGEGNSDVPTCTDCHGSHKIIGPNNSPFRLFSPQICSKCHSNKQMMSKYGINPNVMDSYVSDFHGETVTIFQAMAPGQQTNKPVCIDCHGVHDMLKPSDSHSSVMKANLLTTCQKCHPNASPNFPSSWLSHYSPGPNHFAPVFYIKLLYWLAIPLLIGAALVYIFSDYLHALARLNREG